ncbi:hypothetical protein GCG54_00006816 [Colletotrichum gloeosporioides]|uniref:Uncharacterized protein n=1 Tax=Colletotrichum gloeosporioides TaxID=474922 RepID=A0A8H4CQI1_COLGL|nr:uncharacterized protein GCG54_00006816 [Colletotrichum gloeosporioides]KAF3808200.1 hypothetical protein GCG54_00006816 [Colletotrichum gloeosporioides]
MGSYLTTFMQTYWSERMGIVIHELGDYQLSEEEIQNIEMLGVCPQTQAETSREDEVDGDSSQLDYWYRKLDALV